MNKLGYRELVQTTLNEQWSTYQEPLDMNINDLITGMNLFTKIAIEASQEPTLKVSLESTSLSDLDDKVKKFAEQNAHAFRIICESGFPFSRLESTTTAMALKHVLENYGSIVSSFMTLDNSTWLNEEELEKQYGDTFTSLKARDIGEACNNLKRAYVDNGDNKAGYYLLWLIKKVAGCDFEIPPKELFKALTVHDVLSQFSEFDKIKNPKNFIEILHFRSSRLEYPLYHQFLNSNTKSLFAYFVIYQLKGISMDIWPTKASIITDFLETLTTKVKLELAHTLTGSADSRTVKVGEHLLQGLTAPSLTRAIPHFNALIELLPKFNYTNIERIFNCPFKKFRKDRLIYEKDPDFTRRLTFNDMRQVFVQDSLMIGVYDNCEFVGNGIPPYLLAYDMNTENMVWGIPLVPGLLKSLSLNRLRILRSGPEVYSLKRLGNHIALQFPGEKYIRLIDPKTGELHSIIEIPEASNSPEDCLHINLESFAYQLVSKYDCWILMGGTLRDGKWEVSFTAEAPNRFFQALSTHCGFLRPYENTLVLCGPTGDQIIINNCLAAEARGDKLYLIESDPAHTDKCLLTIRTLKVDSEVVSDIEKSISLDIKQGSFGDLCKNGQWILYSETWSGKSPLFIDLKTEQVIYSDQTFSQGSEQTISIETGDLWNWDNRSQDIWKISSSAIKLMGNLECGHKPTFLHVDNKDNLYFVELP